MNFSVITDLLISFFMASLIVFILRKKASVFLIGFFFISFISTFLVLNLSRYLWKYMSSATARIVYLLLLPFYDLALNTTNQFKPLLTIRSWNIFIGSTCSGIESILLFSGLVLFIFILNKFLKKTNIAPQFWIFSALALIGLYIVNIIRITLIIVFGTEISRYLAVKIFHANLGWIFFLAYFALFWKIVKRRFINDQTETVEA